jgi:hypothetical protein
MTEVHTHIVKFQRGTRVGARSLRMEYVTATNYRDAERKAKALFSNWKQDGYFVLDVLEDDPFEIEELAIWK